MVIYDTPTALGEVGTGSVSDGTSQKMRLGKNNELILGYAHGRYAEASMSGRLFMAQAIVTTPLLWSTEIGTGGPLLWNGSSTVKAVLLAVGFGETTPIDVVGVALGITGGNGQAAAPTTATAIDSTTNLLIGGAPSACTAYRIGTTVNNRFFYPFANLHPGILAADTANMQWVDLGGIVVPQWCYASVAASADATSWVGNICLIWEEIPA